jgi:hypothetical protein
MPVILPQPKKAPFQWIETVDERYGDLAIIEAEAEMPNLLSS